MNTPETTFTSKINGQPVVCNSNLIDFELLKKQSTLIDYYGICRQTSQLFIQFNNGKSFVFLAVPPEVLETAKTIDSIGKYYHSDIKGKYEDIAVEDNCIVAESVEDLDEWDINDESFYPDSDH